MKTLLTHLVIACTLSPAAHAQTWQWAERAGDSGNEAGNAIDVDDEGNSYITGTFHGSATFGSITLTDAAATSVFLAAYDGSGNVLWARVAASGVVIEVRDITRDPSGNLAIVGEYLGTASFGDASAVTVTSSGHHDVFIAQYDDIGGLGWARSFGGPGYDFGIAISHDAVGNLYAAGDLHYGSFSGSASKVYVAKFDASGDQIWLKLPPDYSNFHIANGITTDAAGNSYVIGNFFNTIIFEPITTDAGNIESNAFIAKLDSDGNALWVQKAGAGSGYGGGRDVAVSPAGEVFALCVFHGTVSFGPFSLSSTPDATFLAKCNADGQYQWVRKTDGSNAFPAAIVADGAGACMITGTFSYPIEVGGIELTASDPDNIFVAKADAVGNFTWATTCGGDAPMKAGGIARTGDGVVLVGTFTGAGHFGGSIQLTANGGNDVFIARLHDNMVGIEELHQCDDLVLFPDPTSDALHAQGIIGKANYRIHAMNGTVVLSGTASANAAIDVHTLNPGLYAIELFRSEGHPTLGRSTFLKER